MRIARCFALSLVLGLIAACGGGGDNGTPPPPPPAAPSALSYATPQVLTLNVAAVTVVPTVSGTVTSYTVTPGLPAGLTLNASTGAISGTPTAITTATNYTVTASNAGGSTTAQISIAVNAVAPAIAYADDTQNWTVDTPVDLPAPDNTGGSVVTWTVTPALPAGVTLNSMTGAITGAPTAVTAQANYQITAQNSGGQSSAQLSITVESGVLVDLGHAVGIQRLDATATRVYSLDGQGYWNLWSYADNARIASGRALCDLGTCGVGGSPGPAPRLSGNTLAFRAGLNLEVRDATTGAMIAALPLPLPGNLEWWRLAPDGSYIALATTTSLQTFSRDGTALATRAGNYATANAFLGPNNLLVARGPAGAQVIETVNATTGASTVSAPFLDEFHSWFQDGSRFFTAVGSTIRVYTPDVVQEEIRALPGIGNLAGRGSRYWILGTTVNPTLLVYEIGTAGSIASFVQPGTSLIQQYPRGAALIDHSSGTVNFIDVLDAVPSSSVYMTAVELIEAFAAADETAWVVGNTRGVVFAGPDAPTTPRPFSYGKVLDIAGNALRIVVSTVSGRVLIFDSTTGVLERTIDGEVSDVELSADGSVLATLDTNWYGPRRPDRSVRIYSLPAGTVSYSWDYDFNTPPYPVDITLSGSGTILHRTLTGPGGGRFVTATTGGPTIYSDNVTDRALPLALSPDGSGVAASMEYNALSTTNIYTNGVLVGASTGFATGWFDDNRVFVQVFDQRLTGGLLSRYGATLSRAGAELDRETLPVLYPNVQMLANDQIYSQRENKIFAFSNGETLWTGALPQATVDTEPMLGYRGAVAGARVVYPSGNVVRIEAR